MNYEWDLEKAWVNRKKHKVTFEQAVVALEDPYGLFIFDKNHSVIEDRYIVIGEASGLILTVIEVEAGEDTTRIISARHAKPHEKEEYYGNRSLYIGNRTQTY